MEKSQWKSDLESEKKQKPSKTSWTQRYIGAHWNSTQQNKGMEVEFKSNFIEYIKKMKCNKVCQCCYVSVKSSLVLVLLWPDRKEVIIWWCFYPIIIVVHFHKWTSWAESIFSHVNLSKNQNLIPHNQQIRSHESINGLCCRNNQSSTGIPL